LRQESRLSQEEFYKLMAQYKPQVIENEAQLDELLAGSACPTPLKPLTESRKRRAPMAAKEMGDEDWIWVMLDSGAGAFVAGKKDYKYYDTEESYGSRNGHTYALADDREIPNEGQQRVGVQTSEGNVVMFTTQIAKVLCLRPSGDACSFTTGEVHKGLGSPGVYIRSQRGCT
jgi:hypothetical protein